MGRNKEWSVRMIKFETNDVWGFEWAFKGMRNPMNSWDKSDSNWLFQEIGENDLALARKLINAGSEHRKFLRQIYVSVDITAPMFWWAEYDTYKVGTVRNSCSKMHKIHVKPFEYDDFSHEGIDECGDFVNYDNIRELSDGTIICEYCFEYYYGYCNYFNIVISLLVLWLLHLLNI